MCDSMLDQLWGGSCERGGGGGGGWGCVGGGVDILSDMTAADETF